LGIKRKISALLGAIPPGIPARVKNLRLFSAKLDIKPKEKIGLSEGRQR
jgi:hypothetical protein